MVKLKGYLNAKKNKRNGEKTKLHKIEIVDFSTLHMWYYDAYFITNYVIMFRNCCLHLITNETVFISNSETAKREDKKNQFPGENVVDEKEKKNCIRTITYLILYSLKQF